MNVGDTKKEIEELKKNKIALLLQRLTYDQRQLFKRMYPKGLTEEKYDWAIQQIERTIIKNEIMTLKEAIEQMQPGDILICEYHSFSLVQDGQMFGTCEYGTDCCDIQFENKEDFISHKYFIYKPESEVKLDISGRL